MGWARESKSTKNDANDANKIAANRNQQNLGGRKKYRRHLGGAEIFFFFLKSIFNEWNNIISLLRRLYPKNRGHIITFYKNARGGYTINNERSLMYLSRMYKFLFVRV